MDKPLLLTEIKAEIKGVAKVEDNIKEAKEYALKLKDYYSTIVFDENQISEAKNERADINKVVKKISDYRKNIIAEFKKPIELFETTAKETEKILNETADFVDIQVKTYENKAKDEKRTEIEKIFLEEVKELASIITIDMIFDEKWLNKTTEISSVKSDINNKLSKISSDLAAITSLKSQHELALNSMYLKTFNLGDVLQENSRLIELEKNTVKIEEIKEVIKEEKIEQMLNEKVDNEQDDPIKEYTLKLTGTLSKMERLLTFLELNEIKYEKVKGEKIK